MDALVKAYPTHLAGYDQKDIIWRDGTRMPISDGRQKTFEQLLEAPDIKDQFAIPYPLDGALKAPGLNEDPGRIRNEAFFRKMYGDCRRGEVTPRLKPVAWMPRHGGGTVMVTAVNDVAARLTAVVRDLEILSPGMMQYLVPSAGTYNCRVIAKTTRLSVHAFGAAIDLSTRFGDYWLWSRDKGSGSAWRNRIPREIVEAFEAHGFIWGGKWYHFDTFHFEYRPEVISLAKQGWPRP
jgi:D-alanyl-D-alanine carboxypeptidase